MKAAGISFLTLLILTPPGWCSVRLFRDTEGRKIAAEVLNAGPDWVQIKRIDGQKFTIPLVKLSADDRAWVAEWKKQRDANANATRRELENRAKVVAYCRAQADRQVGDGECWALANEAFKACGLQRPGRHPRVWGRLIDLTKEKPLPGDIVEFRTARFPDSITGPEHTAIVVATAAEGRIVVAEQNWCEIKKVSRREMDPAALISGELMFYRPG